MSLNEKEGGGESREIAFSKLKNAIVDYINAGGDMEDVFDLIEKLDRRGGTVLVSPKHLTTARNYISSAPEDWGNFDDLSGPDTSKLAETIHQVSGAVTSNAPSTIIDLEDIPTQKRIFYMRVLNNVRQIADMWKSLEGNEDIDKNDIQLAKQICQIAETAAYRVVKILIDDNIDTRTKAMSLRAKSLIDEVLNEQNGLSKLGRSQSDVNRVWMKLNEQEDFDGSLSSDYPFVTFESIVKGA